MSEAHEQLSAAAQAISPHIASSPAPDVQFREVLAFPSLSEEMLHILKSYGGEETLPADTLLYTYGDRDTDMFVVFSGEIESRLLVEGGASKCFRMLGPVSSQAS